MVGRNIASMVVIGIVIAGGLAACDKIKGLTGMGGVSTDFRNAQIDVSDTPCSDNTKFSTLVLQDGKFELGQYQFELFGDTKHGDVSGHTTTGDTDDAVFVGNCAIDGQTSQVLFVYGLENGSLKRLGTANLTDNGNGLVQSYDVKDSTILVEQNQGNPPTLTKTSYALLNGKLTNLSPTAAPVVASNEESDTDTVSYQTFHDKLQPYGKWVDHPRWGLAWHPLAADFRPYQNGHWEDSDEYGSIFVSDDAWGDLPYHYGRWGYDPGYGGWLWVPGYVWGPSWVVWRAGEDNIGWFPMPPGAYDGEGDYPDDYDGWYGYRDMYGAAFDEAAFIALWSFVPAVDIFAGNIRERIIDRRGYRGFIGRTRNWTRYGIVHGHVFSRAFDARRFREAFHRDLPGGMRHDFAGRRGPMTSIAAGHRIALHEHAAVGHAMERERGVSGSHGSAMGGFSRPGAGGSAHAVGAYHHGSTGFARSGSGFAHTSGHESGTGGFSRSGSGFSRSSGGSGGYSRSGSGFSRTGSGYSRSGGSSGGSSPIGHGVSRMGGGGFSHPSAMQHQSMPASHPAPAPAHSSSGGHHH